MSAERGFPPSRPLPGPPPGMGGPRRTRAGGDAAPPPGPRRAGGDAAPPPGPRALVPARDRGPALGGATPASRGPRRLAPPRPVRVKATEAGRPQAVSGREVDAVRESWLVEDRWWSEEPLRRRYWEVVTADGRDLVVFRDLEEGRWYVQR